MRRIEPTQSGNLRSTTSIFQDHSFLRKTPSSPSAPLPNIIRLEGSGAATGVPSTRNPPSPTYGSGTMVYGPPSCEVANGVNVAGCGAIQYSRFALSPGVPAITATQYC